jgi:hypothetical protein
MLPDRRQWDKETGNLIVGPSDLKCQEAANGIVYAWMFIWDYPMPDDGNVMKLAMRMSSKEGVPHNCKTFAVRVYERLGVIPEAEEGKDGDADAATATAVDDDAPLVVGDRVSAIVEDSGGYTFGCITEVLEEGEKYRIAFDNAHPAELKDVDAGLVSRSDVPLDPAENCGFRLVSSQPVAVDIDSLDEQHFVLDPPLRIHKGQYIGFAGDEALHLDFQQKWDTPLAAGQFSFNHFWVKNRVYSDEAGSLALGMHRGVSRPGWHVAVECDHPPG